MGAVTGCVRSCPLAGSNAWLGAFGLAVHNVLVLPKLRPGDKVAIVSPSFAAPGAFPEVHRQAMRRIRNTLGLIPVEYPTTARVGATAKDRAADLNSAFADPEIKAVFATVGGNDQITVIPYLDPDVLTVPKPFLGYSDNTNLLNWLWSHGANGFYGGSTQVHLGAGPYIDDIHLRSLRAALFDGGTLELTDPGVSEDFGFDWADPLALTQVGIREPTESWIWAGAENTARGKTWGGCLEVIDQILVAGRGPTPEALGGTILLVETAEDSPSADYVLRILRAMGEAGLLSQIAGVLCARPPASSFRNRPDTAERLAYRQEQAETIINVVTTYNPKAAISIGVPFGHTRPQWVVPYGGIVTIEPNTEKVFAEYR